MIATVIGAEIMDGVFNVGEREPPVDCLGVEVEIVPLRENGNTTIRVEFDPNAGTLGEWRLTVDGECVWSRLA